MLCSYWLAMFPVCELSTSLLVTTYYRDPCSSCGRAVRHLSRITPDKRSLGITSRVSFGSCLVLPFVHGGIFERSQMHVPGLLEVAQDPTNLKTPLLLTLFVEICVIWNLFQKDLDQLNLDVDGARLCGTQPCPVHCRRHIKSMCLTCIRSRFLAVVVKPVFPDIAGGNPLTVRGVQQVLQRRTSWKRKGKWKMHTK